MANALKLAGALTIIIALAMITGFQPLYWLVYVVVGGAILGYLWAWIQSRGLETRVVEISSHPQVGQEVQLMVMVKEKTGLPRIGLRARLISDFSVEGEEDFNLSPKGSTSWTVSGLCRRRGLNTVGSVAIMSGDPSGLVNLECRVGQPESILVYPSTVDLPDAMVEGQAMGGELGEAGQLTGHSPAASLVRDYVPGDSLAHIHWPTTARLNRLMTKEFEGAGINEVWLFVDMEQSAQAGEGDESTEEYSVTIAASLAKSLIKNGHAVGLVAQGDRFYRYSPGKDENHLWGLLKALALMKATGAAPLSSVMAQGTADMISGTVAIVISPRSTHGLGTFFQFLIRRGILVMPVHLDGASFGGASQINPSPEAGIGAKESSFVVRRGDDLAPCLGNVLNQIESN